MMQITIEKKVGTVKAGRMREYRKNPSSLNLASSAAAYTAKKLGEPVVVVEGNSYGTRVYHIAKKSDDLKKYTVMNVEARVLLVEVTGDCFYAVAK